MSCTPAAVGAGWRFRGVLRSPRDQLKAQPVAAEGPAPAQAMWVAALQPANILECQTQYSPFHFSYQDIEAV